MKRTRKTLDMPTDIVEMVEMYQKENYITTFIGAVIELLIKGLDRERSGKDEQQS